MQLGSRCRRGDSDRRGDLEATRKIIEGLVILAVSCGSG
jgi:hypothetical protein